MLAPDIPVFEDLTEDDLYRMAEVEIWGAINQMAGFMSKSAPRSAAEDLILNTWLHGRSEPFIDEFRNALMKRRYNPTKDELIHTLLYNNFQIIQITKQVKCSPNKVIEYKRNVKPCYDPVFQRWDRELLEKWNFLKQYIKLF